MLNKQRLVAEVQKRTGYYKKDISPVLDCIFGVLAETLAAGEDIHIAKFGSFKNHTRPGMRRIDLNTRKEAYSNPKKTVKFRLAKELEEYIEHGED